MTMVTDVSSHLAGPRASLPRAADARRISRFGAGDTRGGTKRRACHGAVRIADGTTQAPRRCNAMAGPPTEDAVGVPVPRQWPYAFFQV